jgi:hypothetical protein
MRNAFRWRRSCSCSLFPAVQNPAHKLRPHAQANWVNAVTNASRHMGGDIDPDATQRALGRVQC